MRYPVWRWNSALDGHVPASQYDPLPSDQGTLFVGALLRPASGGSLKGYLIGLEKFYAFGFFLNDEEHVVNMRLPETIAAAERALTKKLGQPAMLLPLKYSTGLRFADGRTVEGTFDK